MEINKLFYAEEKFKEFLGNLLLATRVENAEIPLNTNWIYGVLKCQAHSLSGNGIRMTYYIEDEEGQEHSFLTFYVRMYQVISESPELEKIDDWEERELWIFGNVQDVMRKILSTIKKDDEIEQGLQAIKTYDEKHGEQFQEKTKSIEDEIMDYTWKINAQLKKKPPKLLDPLINAMIKDFSNNKMNVGYRLRNAHNPSDHAEGDPDKVKRTSELLIQLYYKQYLTIEKAHEFDKLFCGVRVTDLRLSFYTECTIYGTKGYLGQFFPLSQTGNYRDELLECLETYEAETDKLTNFTYDKFYEEPLNLGEMAKWMKKKSNISGRDGRLFRAIFYEFFGGHKTVHNRFKRFYMGDVKKGISGFIVDEVGSTTSRRRDKVQFILDEFSYEQGGGNKTWHTYGIWKNFSVYGVVIPQIATASSLKKGRISFEIVIEDVSRVDETNLGERENNFLLEIETESYLLLDDAFGEVKPDVKDQVKGLLKNVRQMMKKIFKFYPFHPFLLNHPSLYLKVYSGMAKGNHQCFEGIGEEEFFPFLGEAIANNNIDSRKLHVMYDLMGLAKRLGNVDSRGNWEALEFKNMEIKEMVTEFLNSSESEKRRIFNDNYTSLLEELILWIQSDLEDRIYLRAVYWMEHLLYFLGELCNSAFPDWMKGRELAKKWELFIDLLHEKLNDVFNWDVNIWMKTDLEMIENHVIAKTEGLYLLYEYYPNREEGTLLKMNAVDFNFMEKKYLKELADDANATVEYERVQGRETNTYQWFEKAVFKGLREDQGEWIAQRWNTIHDELMKVNQLDVLYEEMERQGKISLFF